MFAIRTIRTGCGRCVRTRQAWIVDDLNIDVKQNVILPTCEENHHDSEQTQYPNPNVTDCPEPGARVEWEGGEDEHNLADYKHENELGSSEPYLLTQIRPILTQSETRRNVLT
jgi:hypothetical protein